MFFSVISYYTKPNKKIALNYSETKDYVKKPATSLAVLCENKNKSVIRGVVGSVPSVSLCEN